MWMAPDKYKIDVPDVNQELMKLEGHLDNREAKISLAKFLRANIGFTTELLTGIKLAPFQEITLRGLMNRNFSMCVWGRGCGKTFIASVFAVLQCIFEPNTKILIAGPTFRTARFIFNNIEKMVNTKGAELLKQAFSCKPSKRNDQYEWIINGGSITAIPLSGEKIRGFRANILLLDEYLLLPEDIINNVLMPFLVAPQNIKERIEIRELEDKLIAQGRMKEEDKVVFENDSKMVALSSASYTFENLFRQYKDWVEKITNEELGNAKYFISQLGYEALPTEMIDQTIIEEAQEGGQSTASFQREYCAQFTDGSDSYFSAKKMHQCTIPDGEEPTTKIKGEPGAKYVLAIDPSFSNSPTSDYFAMSVLEIDDETEDAILVHSYAVAGGDLKNHIKYMYYLVTHFSFEMIIIDNAGYQFIDSCNESDLFTKNRINLKFFDFDSDKEGIDYKKMLIEAKKQYSGGDGRIVFKQNFSTKFIRTANEHLQACIDHKRIWFASKTTANDGAFTKEVNKHISLKNTPNESVLDLIEMQDAWIYQTKKQCALVEVKSTAKGSQTFDLPQHLKRSTSPSRARKDNYTTLMLACWATKCYYDIVKLRVESKAPTFSPIMIR